MSNRIHIIVHNFILFRFSCFRKCAHESILLCRTSFSFAALVRRCDCRFAVQVQVRLLLHFERSAAWTMNNGQFGRVSRKSEVKHQIVVALRRTCRFLDFARFVGDFSVFQCKWLTIKVSRTAANLFVDKFIRFGCIERLPNAHRCLIEMAGATFWYMRITINLQLKWETHEKHTGTMNEVSERTNEKWWMEGQTVRWWCAPYLFILLFVLIVVVGFQR